MSRFALTCLVIAMATIGGPANAASERVDTICAQRHPGLSQYFNRKKCVEDETLVELQENLAKQREDSARPCIAADISRMEGLAAKAQIQISEDQSLEDVQKLLGVVLGWPGNIQIPDDNIKERVLVTSIPTQCDSKFRLLLNVRESADRKLAWFSVWSMDPPKGYPEGMRSEFGKDFAAIRERARNQLQREREQAQIRTSLEKQEREQEERRRKALQGISIADHRMGCIGSGQCMVRTLEVLLTNITQEPIKEIGLGWAFLGPTMKECPSNLATLQQLYITLQPGESVRRSIAVPNGPLSTNARYCVRITNLRGLYPWEK